MYTPSNCVRLGVHSHCHPFSVCRTTYTIRIPKFSAAHSIVLAWRTTTTAFASMRNCLQQKKIHSANNRNKLNGIRALCEHWWDRNETMMLLASRILNKNARSMHAAEPSTLSGTDNGSIAHTHTHTNCNSVIVDDSSALKLWKHVQLPPVRPFGCQFFSGCERKWHQRHMYFRSFAFFVHRQCDGNCNRLTQNKRQMNRFGGRHPQNGHDRRPQPTITTANGKWCCNYYTYLQTCLVPSHSNGSWMTRRRCHPLSELAPSRDM